jgi:hypothetical protein
VGNLNRVSDVKESILNQCHVCSLYADVLMQLELYVALIFVVRLVNNADLTVYAV